MELIPEGVVFCDDRPSWDEYFLRITKEIATRGTCKRRKTGALLIDEDHRPLSWGYNGKASGLPNCSTYYIKMNKDGTDEKIYPYACAGACAPSGTNLQGCEALHGEWNALLYCTDVRRIHTCYTLASPCITCIGMLLGTACKRIVFSEEYPHPESKRRWLDAGREWVHLSITQKGI